MGLIKRTLLKATFLMGGGGGSLCQSGPHYNWLHLWNNMLQAKLQLYESCRRFNPPVGLAPHYHMPILLKLYRCLKMTDLKLCTIIYIY